MPQMLDHPSMDEIGLGVVFAALADPIRRTAIATLAALPKGTERTCASFGFPVTKASLTHHFKVLREAGLITQIDYGNRRTCTLRQDELEKRFPGLLPLLVNERHKT